MLNVTFEGFSSQIHLPQVTAQYRKQTSTTRISALEDVLSVQTAMSVKNVVSKK